MIIQAPIKKIQLLAMFCTREVTKMIQGFIGNTISRYKKRHSIIEPAKIVA